MDGTQQLVATAGLGLVGVNFWTSSQRSAVTGTLWDKRDPKAAHKALVAIAGELLLVFILVMVAGQSDSLAYGMLAILASLWILWATQHYGAKSQTSATSPHNHVTAAPSA